MVLSDALVLVVAGLLNQEGGNTHAHVFRVTEIWNMTVRIARKGLNLGIVIWDTDVDNVLSNDLPLSGARNVSWN